MSPFSMHSYVPYLIALPFIALVLLRNMGARRLRIEALWVFPALLLLVAGVAFSHIGTPTPGYIAAIVAAIIIGGVLGWMRGKMMRISVHPETHEITAQASPIAMIFILVLVVVRIGARIALGENVTALHMTLEQLSDLFLALVIALFSVMRLEMGLRAWRLLAEARAAKAAAA